MTSIALAKLPESIQGPAFDAAFAAGNEYAVRTHREPTDLTVTAQTIQVADAYIQRTGAVITGNNPLAIDRAAFSRNMMTLASYMKQHAIESISVSKDTLEGVPGSVIIGAAEALFARGF